VIFTPEYFTTVRMVAKYYQSYATEPIGYIVGNSVSSLVLAFISVALCIASRRGSRTELAVVLLVGATAMWLGAVAQMKGYVHHFLPVFGMTGAAVLIVWPKKLEWAALISAAVIGSYYLISGAQTMTAWQRGYPTYLPQTTQVVNRYAPRGPVMLLSVGLAPGFPLINETGAEWTLPMSSLWMVGPLYHGAGRAAVRQGYRGPRDWGLFEKSVHDAIWTSLQQRPPKIMLVQERNDSIDLLAFVTADPRAEQYFQRWQVVDSAGKYVVLLPPTLN
jgi:hypothetical protein